MSTSPQFMKYLIFGLLLFCKALSLPAFYNESGIISSTNSRHLKELTVWNNRKSNKRVRNVVDKLTSNMNSAANVNANCNSSLSVWCQIPAPSKRSIVCIIFEFFNDLCISVCFDFPHRPMTLKGGN